MTITQLANKHRWITVEHKVFPHYFIFEFIETLHMEISSTNNFQKSASKYKFYFNLLLFLRYAYQEILFTPVVLI